MPDVHFTNLLIVVAVGLVAPLALGLFPRFRLPAIVLEIVLGIASSSAPARATVKVLGIASFEDGVAQARFNDLSHWGYGTGWGVIRGLLDAGGLPARGATAAHGAAV